jgi:hypothetical protein
MADGKNFDDEIANQIRALEEQRKGKGPAKGVDGEKN